MRILILDRSHDYSKRFKYYFEKKYPHLQVATFDDAKAALQHLEAESYDVLLFDSYFENVETGDVFSGAFAYLSSTHEVINDTETIFKYSSVTELYSAVCAVYEQKKKRVIKTETKKEEVRKETNIITFLPVHGGAGSSTMAAACAIWLSREANVLYINMEQKTSDFVFFESESKKSFTDIISAMKTKYDTESIKLTLQQIIQSDRKQGSNNLSYIKGYNNIMDCVAIQPSHIDFIFKILRENFNYQYIIIDTDFIVSDVLKRIICMSDKIVFTSSGSDISNVKLSKIQRYLEVMGREEDIELPGSYIIFNQYYGLEDVQSVIKDMELIADFPRFRTKDSSRISSQKIIEEVIRNQNVFSKLM